MAQDEQTVKNKEWIHHHKHHGGATGGALYGLGFIGALIYYISTATSFGLGLLGILKAIAWPAFVVYELMKYLHM